MQQEEIEMQLWDYIDGNCSRDEHQRIQLLIATDVSWGSMYKELLSFHTDIATHATPENVMPDFTIQVMQQIIPAQSAKKSVLNRGIMIIASFFIATISVATIYYLTTLSWESHPSKLLLPDFDYTIALPNNTAMFTGFIIVVMALAIGDTYLRKRNPDTI